MSAQPANFSRSLSSAAWSFARNINSILPHRKFLSRLGRPVRFPEAGREFQWRLAFRDELCRSVRAAIETQWTV